MLSDIKELYKYRELMFALAEREIKSRYKQSLIGLSWAIIQPLSMMLIFTFVFSKVVRVEDSNVNYSILVFSALLPWNFFSKSISYASNSLVSNRLLVTKVYFPKEVLPISLIIANIIDFIIGFIFLIMLMLYYNVSFSFNLLFLIPLFILQLFFTLGVSLLLSSLNVFYRDVSSALPLVIQVWMYGCPIIYSTNIIPEKYMDYYMILNPLSPIIEAYKDIIVRATFPNLFYLSISSMITIVLNILVYNNFKKSEKVFSDII
ncbi:MAG: ABC transporter permease [Candidatus Sericytochromatia bacterium]